MRSCTRQRPRGAFASCWSWEEERHVEHQGIDPRAATRALWMSKTPFLARFSPPVGHANEKIELPAAVPPFSF